jgi:hypothetical protein
MISPRIDHVEPIGIDSRRDVNLDRDAFAGDAAR